jgi:hypothetical protein
MTPPPPRPPGTRAIPILLVAASILWGNAFRIYPYSGDGTATLLVVLLPLVAATIIFLYPWGPESPLRKVLGWTLLLVGGLWLTFSSLYLGFFYLIALTTGWD